MDSRHVFKPSRSGELGRPKAFALLLVLPLAFAIHLAPGFFRAWLVYDRTALVHGELWRLWTGHLVHFSNSHLLLDTFVSAIVLLSLSRFAKRDRVWLLVFFPPLLKSRAFRNASWPVFLRRPLRLGGWLICVFLPLRSPKSFAVPICLLALVRGIYRQNNLRIRNARTAPSHLFKRNRPQ